jgi:hypothetical protein
MGILIFAFSSEDLQNWIMLTELFLWKTDHFNGLNLVVFLLKFFGTSIYAVFLANGQYNPIQNLAVILFFIGLFGV